MTYRVREGLSFCMVHRQAIFLDIDADRYFRLPADLERSFLSWQETQDPVVGADLGKLAALNIITSAAHEQPVAPRTAETPTRSALELCRSAPVLSPRIIPEVLSDVLTIRRQLHKRRLRDVLADAVAHRAVRVHSRTSAIEDHRHNPIHLARQFRRTRLHVPIEHCCLPDSLALLRFLARRRVGANVVFGVTCEPFAAHCWVQVGDMVLNDTVGNALTHTPIKVL